MLTFTKFIEEGLFSSFKRKPDDSVLNTVGSDDNRNQSFNINKAFYDQKFHEHPSVVANNLTPADITLLQFYAKTGYFSINNYLRNRSGSLSGYGHDKPVIKQTDDIKAVQSNIESLWKLFSPENTNKKSITVVSGLSVPSALEIQKNKKGTFAGFTSATTSMSVAQSFSDLHQHKGEKFIAKMVVSPGSAISIAKYVHNSENEVLIEAGAKWVLTGTDEYEEDKILLLSVSKGNRSFRDYGDYRE